MEIIPPVMSLCLHPGLVRTNVVRDMPWYGRSSPTSRHQRAPEIDLDMPVLCELDTARTYLLERRMTTTDDNSGNDGDSSMVATGRCGNEPPPLLEKADGNDDAFCRLRDIITRHLLVEYA